MRYTQTNTALRPSQYVKASTTRASKSTTHAQCKPPAPAKRKVEDPNRTKAVRALACVRSLADRNALMKEIITDEIARRGIKPGDPRFAPEYRIETQKLSAETLEARG